MKKGQTRIDGIDDKIIGLYAAGLSVRDIPAMAQKVADKVQEVKAETQIAVHYAEEEIAHLHAIIGDQLNEIYALKMQIKNLEEKLAIASEAHTR